MTINTIDIASLLSPAKPAKMGIAIIGCDLALPFFPSTHFCVFIQALLQGQALLPWWLIFSRRGWKRTWRDEFFHESENNCAKTWVLRYRNEQTLSDLLILSQEVALRVKCCLQRAAENWYCRRHEEFRESSICQACLIKFYVEVPFICPWQCRLNVSSKIVLCLYQQHLKLSPQACPVIFIDLNLGFHSTVFNRSKYNSVVTDIYESIYIEPGRGFHFVLYF